VISERDAVKGKTLISVAAIIESEENMILLMWEGDLPYHECWVIPGGYVKPDETVKQSVAREVKEETGISILPVKFVGIYEDFLSEKDEPIHHVIIAYEARVVGGRIIMTREARKYAWMDPAEVLGSSQVPDIFKRIIDDFRKQKANRLISRLRNFLMPISNSQTTLCLKDIGKKDDDRVRVNAIKGTWISSFGSGFIERSK